jgi:hypothetical protein
MKEGRGSSVTLGHGQWREEPLKDKESASRLCSSSFDLIAQILLYEYWV